MVKIESGSTRHAHDVAIASGAYSFTRRWSTRFDQTDKAAGPLSDATPRMRSKPKNGFVPREAPERFTSRLLTSQCGGLPTLFLVSAETVGNACDGSTGGASGFLSGTPRSGKVARTDYHWVRSGIAIGFLAHVTSLVGGEDGLS